MKKEVIYTVDTDTEKGIIEAEKIQQKMYEKYNSVQICPNGLCQVRIICTEPIKK